MSKETTKARILNEITNALANDSITPVIVGGILDEILELDSRPYKIYKARFDYVDDATPLVVTVLENTISPDIAITRYNEHYYEVMSPSFPFIHSKLDIDYRCKNNSRYSPSAVLYSANEIDLYGLYLTQDTRTTGGIEFGLHDTLKHLTLEIKQYN